MLKMHVAAEDTDLSAQGSDFYNHVVKNNQPRQNNLNNVYIGTALCQCKIQTLIMNILHQKLILS